MSGTNPPARKTRLKAYASKVFRESSVTAVAEIASTAHTSRKLFKALVLVICLTGFLYQCGAFLAHVLEYPTTVDIKISQPDQINLPAYSFCNTNVISRRKYCKRYPENCIEMDTSHSPSGCGSKKTMVPKIENIKSVRNLTKTEFREVGQDFKTFLTVVRNRTGTIPHDEFQGPFLRTKGYERLICYGLRSVAFSLDFPSSEIMENIEDKFIESFRFNVECDDTFIIDRKPGMLFTVHSPLKDVNPTDRGIFMRPGWQYRIFFRVEEEILLPHPYDTDCLNYTDVWHKSKSPVPRNRDMCVNSCLKEAHLQSFNCSSPRVYHKEITCPPNHNYTMDKASEMSLYQCKLKCKDDCLLQRYQINYEERMIERRPEDYGSSWNLTEPKYILVDVFLESMEVRTFRHKPKYKMVEYFSYIGGFSGVWLGISLVQITDILESLFRILRYALKKSPQKKPTRPSDGSEICL